jgi:protein TonB
MSHSARNALIAGGVVLLHVAFLWALQTGLLRRAAEVIVPVELLSAIITPPAPEAAPVPQPKVEQSVQQPVVRKSTPLPRPAPQPIAVPDRTPAPSAPVGTSDPQPPAPPITAPMTSAAPPAPASPTPPAPRVEQLTDADYLQNPPPAYPKMSLRLGEEGTTLVGVLIGTDGRVLATRIAKSSGFPRLDEAAEVQVRDKWKFVPRKRDGVPEAMWANAPVKFELSK